MLLSTITLLTVALLKLNVFDVELISCRQALICIRHITFRYAHYLTTIDSHLKCTRNFAAAVPFQQVYRLRCIGFEDETLMLVREFDLYHARKRCSYNWE